MPTQLLTDDAKDIIGGWKRHAATEVRADDSVVLHGCRV